MKKKLLSTLLLLCLFASLLTGCGASSLESKLPGTWTLGDSSYNRDYGHDHHYFYTLHIYDDGTFDFDSDESCSWAIVNGDCLKFTYSSQITWEYGESETWKISINGNEMRLTDPEDNSLYAVYTKQ